MLFVSLSDPDALNSFPKGIDGIEWRLDLTHDLPLERIAAFLKISPIPVMLTLRKANQGGRFKGSEEARENLILKLLALNPQYFDIEHDSRPEFLALIKKQSPATRIILSSHHFKEVPDDLEKFYHSMAKIPAFAYKIAITPESSTEALQALKISKNHPDLSIICMGETGAFARVLGPVAGNVIDYACLDEESKTAAGQLTAAEFVDIYRYHTLNENTALYGLIGNPVDQSIGHLHHNGIFDKNRLNALYVKMKVIEEELPQFLKAASHFGFRGLSVTMPLKEKVIPYLQGISQKAFEIGAVNTLSLYGDMIFADNTDCAGALDAIESHQPVKGKSVIVLGAGGAAKAIAYEAVERGAEVTILNRTESKAEELAKKLGCRWGSLTDVPLNYDMMVNCIPKIIPIEREKISPDGMLMDITANPKVTTFLQAGIDAGCKVIYGEEMFLRQATLQRKIWDISHQPQMILQECSS